MTLQTRWTFLPNFHFAQPRMFDATNRFSVPPRWGLRHVKRIYTDLVDEFSKGELSHALEGPLSPYPESVRSPGKLLRMWLRSPWDDYTLIRSGSVEPSLASCPESTSLEPQSGSFRIREAWSFFKPSQESNIPTSPQYTMCIVTAIRFLPLQNILSCP